ncbi:hypothetical protein H9P43_002028 [Blastocladiella emersonii ATCC 22665]|nr:hypothetical protein H9P43_002028 [Blastocladiella emersonii ATCC 22665]
MESSYIVVPAAALPSLIQQYNLAQTLQFQQASLAAATASPMLLTNNLGLGGGGSLAQLNPMYSMAAVPGAPLQQFQGTMPLPLARSLTLVLVVAAAAALVATAAPLEKRQTASAAPAAFQLSFTCDATAPVFCAKAERALQRAARRITQEFRFRRTVTCAVTFFLPCGSASPPASCSETRLLGSATPTAFYPVRLKDDGQLYTVPSALLKQFDHPELDDASRVAYPAFDLRARFNAARTWWFAEDGDPPGGNGTLAQNTFDLERVATHELLHGLGFGSNVLLGLPIASDTKPAFILPQYESSPPSTPPSLGVVMSADPFYRFAHPGLWDRFTVFSNGVPATAYGANITRAFDRLVAAGTIKPAGSSGGASYYNPQAVVDALAADPDASSAMQALARFGTTRESLVFDTDAWPPSSAASPNSAVKYPLETGLAPFTPGRSAVHLADTVARNADFLMVWASNRQTYGSMIAATQAPESGLGPATVAILTALGYARSSATGFTSRANLIELVPETFGTVSHAAAFAAPSVWTCTAVVMALALSL